MGRGTGGVSLIVLLLVFVLLLLIIALTCRTTYLTHGTDNSTKYKVSIQFLCVCVCGGGGGGGVRERERPGVWPYMLFTCVIFFHVSLLTYTSRIVKTIPGSSTLFLVLFFVFVQNKL